MFETRDIIYLYYEKDKNKVISYGIEFREFMASIDVKPENMLILQGEFGTSFDFTTLCEYCTKEDLDEFLKEDVYSYGNFSWVDFETIEGLSSLGPQEVAELFYLAKLWHPIKTAYFKKLNNRFSYNAHDDGWINHIFYNNEADFVEVIQNIIPMKIHSIYHNKIAQISEDIARKICGLSEMGVAFDFKKVKFKNGKVVVPIFEIGKYLDMDKMYDDISSNKFEATRNLIFESELVSIKMLTNEVNT
ncbi:hypothetical protein [Fusibacter bizertensis]